MSKDKGNSSKGDSSQQSGNNSSGSASQSHSREGLKGGNTLPTYQAPSPPPKEKK